MEKLIQASQYIKDKTNFMPKIGMILGSGLGDIADNLENSQSFEYKDIPNMPISTVEGHKGRFVVTENVIYMQGRFHYYEGYSMNEVTLPVRLMKLLGVEVLIITNAAGGINPNFKVGDLMLITDHINMMGNNPLIGKNLDDLGERFPDMSNCYNSDLRHLVKEVAKECSIELQEGVYFANTGPSYETPAEVKMGRILGGDAVGMSTAPEAIVANHCKMKVIGISCITNMATGMGHDTLNHDEVIETSKEVKPRFIKLINSIIEKL